MLYGSTRSKVESDTAQRTLWKDRAGDGGLFVPMKLPQFKRTEILRLKSRTLEENIALILNRLFQTELLGKDVEFAIGREFYALTNINQKLTMVEFWHNSEGSVHQTVRLLIQRLATETRETEPGEWPGIAVRTALLFGLFGEMGKQGELDVLHPVDLSVPAGDFAWPMAAWYGRKMGLPIGNIVVCCTENEGVRELLYRGQIRLDVPAVNTLVSRYDDPAPIGLERLVYAVLGREAAAEFGRIREQRDTYVLNPEQRRALAEGMVVPVCSNIRLANVIPNVYRTYGKILCPYGALVYAGAMDHQATTGKNCRVLMITEFGPEHSLGTIARAMGLPASEVKKRLSQK